jgi:hypothetical protein
LAVGSGRAVEADHGVHVDSGALLVFGDASEGQSRVLREVGLYEACRGGEVSSYVPGEAVPQDARVCVPEHVVGVVVAAGAQRLADEGSVRSVDDSAAEGTPVRTGTPIATRAATPLPGTMDGSERGRSEGDEESGAVADGGGDVLAAEEARADEVVGVARVQS